MQLRIGLAELVGSLSPNHPDETLFRLLEELQTECGLINEDLTPEKMASVDIRLHACKCRLIGNEVLHDIYDELYHRTTRLWFSLLPRIKLSVEFKTVSDDVDQTLRALRRGDVKAVGFITRNNNSAGLIRMDEILNTTGDKI